MKNRCFKVKNLDAVLDVIVGTKESQRPPSADGFWLVKLKEGDKKNHDCLKGCEEVKDIQKELKSEKWH
jgi:hypothetical protein